MSCRQADKNVIISEKNLISYKKWPLSFADRSLKTTFSCGFARAVTPIHLLLVNAAITVVYLAGLELVWSSLGAEFEFKENFSTKMGNIGLVILARRFLCLDESL